MTTSGTIGSTQIDVTTLIEHAARRCGVLASSLSLEQQISAKENLYFILTSLANLGINLWCVDSVTIPLVIGQNYIDLPVGTVEVLNANYKYASTGTEVTMGVLNRDDYTSIPNKLSPGNPLQYWYDKRFPQPRMWLWPAPANLDSIVVWKHHHVQDVGTMTNVLDLPSRWFEGVIFSLAHRMSFELPGVDPGRIPILKAHADEFLAQAERGESDGAPIRIAPVIRGYTA